MKKNEKVRDDEGCACLPVRPSEIAAAPIDPDLTERSGKKNALVDAHSEGQLTVSSAIPEPAAADAARHIVPFYSERTLDETQVLVQDLAAGVAVFIRKDGAVATIGTRGIRPLDGKPGLIIHLLVRLEADGSVKMVPSTLIEKPFENLAHTHLAPSELFELLIGTLAGADLLPPENKLSR